MIIFPKKLESSDFPMKLKDIPKEKLSPGMRQYVEVKENYPDCIVFFRIGDFYEMFFDDAILVSRELELTLTGKECGLDERAPMCGVPYHSVDIYLKRLVDYGYKIAICDQITDPALSHGLVEREVTRIVTPGTLIETSLLDDDTNNFVCVLYCDETTACALVFADISTGEMKLCDLTHYADPDTAIVDTLSQYTPTELLLNDIATKHHNVIDFVQTRLQCAITRKGDRYFDKKSSELLICEQFHVESIDLLGIPEGDAPICAIGGCLAYIQETQKSNTSRFTEIEMMDTAGIMGLDLTARRNLELTQTLRSGERRGSLLWLLDNTRTAMGKRLLKTWVEQPLIQPVQIMARQDAVEALVKNSLALMEIRDILDSIYDLERLMTRVIFQKASPRDLKSLSATAVQLPALKKCLRQLSSSRLLASLEEKISSLERVATLVDNAIIEDPPISLKDGGVIRDGFSEDLDEQRNLMNGGTGMLDKILEREKERTGIRGLKIGNNRVFGYYLEVTRSYYDLIPNDYIRKQTLANSERFITEELKDVENKIVGAKDRALRLEEAIFTEVRDCLAEMLRSVQETAAAVAMVDVLASLANVAIAGNYTKPEIAIDGKIQITAGRHPVVECQQNEEVFVPNDTYLDPKDQRMLIITGPNMSGKSTYMRQTALITLLAQIGSFVPADYARISVVDKIFTRIGASDDLAAGQSTFMVEMSEVSDILEHATKNSLVIFDEVGRGTSTLDGVSIAQAVVEYTAKKIGCKTMFATHYHELLALEEKIPGVKNFSVAVKRHGESIRFLRKIVPGGVDDSYGIAVAKLAGLPSTVTKRAEKILLQLEQEAQHENDNSNKSQQQITFAAMQQERVLSMLQKTNPDELSDAECRDMLVDVIKMLKTT